MPLSVLLFQWWGDGHDEKAWHRVTSTDFIAPVLVAGAWASFVVLWTIATASLRIADQLADENGRLRARLDEENSSDAVAARLDEFARECELMRSEIPSDTDTMGNPAIANTASSWPGARCDLEWRVESELRRNAPGFLDYWRSGEGLPPPQPFGPWARALTDLSVRQLRHIAARLREGYDEPRAEEWTARSEGKRAA